MILPTTIREALVKRLRERGDYFSVHGMGGEPLPPLTYEHLMEVCAIELLAYLCETAPVLDGKACGAQAKVVTEELYGQPGGLRKKINHAFYNGAIWQQDNVKAQVSALRAELINHEPWKAHLRNVNKALVAEIERLKAVKGL